MSSTPTPLHVVVGAGPVGRALAGQPGRSRPPGPRPHPQRHRAGPPRRGAPGRRRHPAGPARGGRRGATVLYNAANPRDYHRWESIWPPLRPASSAPHVPPAPCSPRSATSILTGPVKGRCTRVCRTRRRTRTDRCGPGCGPTRSPPTGPGTSRAVEVRASDYAGDGAYSHLSVAADSLVAGKTARLIGDPDQPHSWTGTADTARTLIAAAASADAHGHTWLVPTNAPRTQREVLTEVAPQPACRWSASPRWVAWGSVPSGW